MLNIKSSEGYRGGLYDRSIIQLATIVRLSAIPPAFCEGGKYLVNGIG